MTDPVPPPPRVDEAGLRWLLVIVMMANAAIVLYSVTSIDQFQDVIPGMTDRLRWVLVGSAAVTLVAGLLLLQWYRWGAIGVAGGMLGSTVTTILADAPLSYILLGPVGIGLVGFFLWPARDRLH